jgi:hypothetical protein
MGITYGCIHSYIRARCCMQCLGVIHMNTPYQSQHRKTMLCHTALPAWPPPPNIPPRPTSHSAAPFAIAGAPAASFRTRSVLPPRSEGACPLQGSCPAPGSELGQGRPPPPGQCSSSTPLAATAARKRLPHPAGVAGTGACSWRPYLLRRRAVGAATWIMRLAYPCTTPHLGAPVSHHMHTATPPWPAARPRLWARDAKHASPCRAARVRPRRVPAAQRANLRAPCCVLACVVAISSTNPMPSRAPPLCAPPALPSPAARCKLAPAPMPRAACTLHAAPLSRACMRACARALSCAH